MLNIHPKNKQHTYKGGQNLSESGQPPSKGAENPPRTLPTRLLGAESHPNMANLRPKACETRQKC